MEVANSSTRSLIGRVSATEVDHGHLDALHKQLPRLLIEGPALRHLGQCLAKDEHVRVLPPDLKLVKLLVTDVVSYVLDDEEDGGPKRCKVNLKSKLLQLNVHSRGAGFQSLH